MTTSKKAPNGISNRHNIPSPYFNQYERILLSGYPYQELTSQLEMRLVELYDTKRSGIVNEWIKTRGTDGNIEFMLDTKAKKLAKALDALEYEWNTSGKHKHERIMAERGNTKKNALRAFLLVLFLAVVAGIGIVGVDEVTRKMVPKIMRFIQETHSTSRGYDYDQQQQKEKEKMNLNQDPKESASASFSASSNNNNIHNSFKKSSAFLPTPPPGYLSWVTYFVKYFGIREHIQSLLSHSRNSNQATCRCGEWSPMSVDFGNEENSESNNNNVNKKDDGNLKTEDTRTDQQLNEDAMKNNGDKSNIDGQSKEKPSHLDHHELPPKYPSKQGKKFISKAANVFRKASGMWLPSSSDARDGDDAETDDGSTTNNNNQKNNIVDKGILQPAFLLESSEASYHQHISWLSTRFEPSIRVLDLSWQEIANEDTISEFLFWQTGWLTTISSSDSATEGSSSSSCCTILSIPDAIAPVSRFKNATRDSILPYLVEKLNKFNNNNNNNNAKGGGGGGTNGLSYSIQDNAGCKIVVVARIDPIRDTEIRTKRTYKRLKSMFSNFIL